MKRTNLFFAIMIPAILIVFCTCDEKIIRDDCKDRNDIKLALTATYFTDCNPNEVLSAHGAGFTIIRGNDTLFSGNLDKNGRFETGPIDSSSCGMNNVIVEASYKGKSVREKFGVLCCDTTLQYLFSNVSCSPPDSVKCVSIDTTIVKNITSSGDCVMQNATLNELKDNTIIIATKNQIRIDLKELLNLKGKIYVESLNPRPEGNDIVLKGNQLEIYFNVDKKELGAIQPVTIKLPTYCLDSDGKTVNSGTITLILKATVCDPNNCSCPFGEMVNPTVFYAPEGVKVGQNKTFDFTVAELSEGNFGKGCILKIDSIKRTDGSAATSKGNHSWIINSFSPTQLTMGEKLTVSANFEPDKPGELSDDFRVFTSVYSAADPTNRKNSSTCSFLFRLKGESCEDLKCPQIQILGYNANLADNNGQTETPLIVGTTIDMQSGIIRQKINARITTDCLHQKDEKGMAAFEVLIPEGNYCEDVQLSVQESSMGTADDRGFFSATPSGFKLNSTLDKLGFIIYFSPPDLATFYASNHDSLYQCRFELVASDQAGKEICHQEIEVTAQVFEFSLRSGDVIPMEAFSQVSAKSSQPSYHVYDIDYYNSTLGNYGLRESLTPNFVDFSKKPNTPLSSHSLYFDVDHPDDPVVNFTENPKLYLINTPGNNFSKITATPVMTYSTPDEFFKAYKNGSLMDLIFSKSNPDYFSWSPERDKSEFPDGGGITIQPQEVYVVWDPNGAINTYTDALGDKKRVFCGMALLYISSVKSGADNDTPPTSGGNGKASVSFYVEYPVKY